MGEANRQVILVARPTGIAQAADFAIRPGPINQPGPGQILVRNHYLSVEPAMRGWIADSGSYAAPVAIGSVMRALAAGQVVASGDAAYQVGDHVTGWFGWQDYACVSTDQVVQRTRAAEMRAALGILGINGVTAYLALTLIGQPRAAAGPLPQPKRVYHITDPVTMDHRPDRLNIDLDGDGAIVRLWCG